MTRHFMRDRNGEEFELIGLDSFRRFIESHGIGLLGLKFYAVGVWINQKLEFIVWQEV